MKLVFKLMQKVHQSVLLNETVNNLVINKSGIYVDGTIGFAGHAKKIMSKLDKKGKLIGIDLDSYALKCSKDNLSQFPKQSYSLYKGNFSEFPKILKKIGISEVDGLVVDLGISSYQINSGHRGFSYINDGKLDMRFNNENGISAKELLNNINEDDLSRIIKIYGQEKKHRRIAISIIKYSNKGKMNTTYDLKHAIEAVANNRFIKKTLSRVFQAIRIKINREIENLNLFLDESLNYLKKGGRVAIISFHSIEDKIVQNFFKKYSTGCICPSIFPICICNNKAKIKTIIKKGILPSDREISLNSRSRSARLRIAEYI